MSRLHIDNLDTKILQMLVDNGRKPFLEIARECGVSGAAIHQRIAKLQATNILEGSRALIRPTTLPLSASSSKTPTSLPVSLKNSKKFLKWLNAITPPASMTCSSKSMPKTTSICFTLFTRRYSRSAYFAPKLSYLSAKCSAVPSL